MTTVQSDMIRAREYIYNMYQDHPEILQQRVAEFMEEKAGKSPWKTTFGESTFNTAVRFLIEGFSFAVNGTVQSSTDKKSHELALHLLYGKFEKGEAHLDKFLLKIQEGRLLSPQAKALKQEIKNIQAEIDALVIEIEACAQVLSEAVPISEGSICIQNFVSWKDGIPAWHETLHLEQVCSENLQEVQEFVKANPFDEADPVLHTSMDAISWAKQEYERSLKTLYFLLGCKTARLEKLRSNNAAAVAESIGQEIKKIEQDISAVEEKISTITKEKQYGEEALQVLESMPESAGTDMPDNVISYIGIYSGCRHAFPDWVKSIVNLKEFAIAQGSQIDIASLELAPPFDPQSLKHSVERAQEYYTFALNMLQLVLEYKNEQLEKLNNSSTDSEVAASSSSAG